MKRQLVTLGLVALLGGSGCAYQPWQANSAAAAKPRSPITASPDAATLLVVLNEPAGLGNGSGTVFEPDGTPVAQFDSTANGWFMARAAPGNHRYYVRGSASSFCSRADAKLEAGKIYMLVIALGIGTGSAFIERKPNEPPPGGTLYFLPYLELNAPAARAEIAAHRAQMDDCITNADKSFGQVLPATVHQGGWETIDFAVPTQPSPQASAAAP